MNILIYSYILYYLALNLLLNKRQILFIIYSDKIFKVKIKYKKSHLVALNLL